MTMRAWIRRVGPGACAAALAATTAVLAAGGQSAAPRKPSAMVTSAAQRRAYLANATIWHDRATPSPEQIVEGPTGLGVAGRAQLNPPDGLPCTWKSGGGTMGGNTPKFTCTTAAGVSLRVKYFDFDATRGNREVFAEVAATRLFWALGFDADAVYPITVNCIGCPANPMTGKGPRANRKYIGVTEAFYVGTPVLSTANMDEGWRFGDLDSAIDSLPDGPLKAKQRAHFDALSLLGVFIQHGDRKPEQQRLVCRSDVDIRAGSLRTLGGNQRTAVPLALFERAGASACSTTVATVQDLGATFGGSGSLWNSKADLDGWASRKVFLSAGDERSPGGCRGDVSAILRSGTGARTDPKIGEAGRNLLATLLVRLTDAQIRALFNAARFDAVDSGDRWTDPAGKTFSGLDAWVAVFEHKRAQIVAARCTD
jgi:hypothetical protein